MKILSLILILILFGCTEQEPEFKNLDFENYCAINSDTCVWQKSWGKENCCEIQSIAGKSVLNINGLESNSVSFIEQELIAPSQKEIRILTVSAIIKTSDIEGKGGGLNIGIYDKDDELIANKDMGGFYSLNWKTENSDWEKKNLSIVCPGNTHKFKIGAILYGKGEAQFDNFEIQFVDINPGNRIKESPIITEAIEIVQKNSLFRDSIDYKELRSKVALIAKAADTNLALGYLLDRLRAYGDNHSYFLNTQEATSWEENEDPEGTIEFSRIALKENIGVISVPPFNSGNEKLMVAYADSLQKGLKRTYSKRLKGWIVDLRQNTGGNMEPMIVGLGPLLDSGKIGSLVDVNGNHEHWYYQDGQYYWEDEKGIYLEEPFILDKKLPIVVLTSPQTGSSGEVVAISFIGNTKTISMGEPTWGLTTGNGEFELKDGSKLFMASTKMVDRNGVIYTSKIEPDYSINKDDDIINSAIKWIIKNR